MKRIEKIKGFLLSGEREKCRVYLREICGEYDCPSYFNALSRILLVEAVKELNDTICEFYCDEKELIDKLFAEEAFDMESALRLVCNKVKESSKMHSDVCFAKVKNYIQRNYTDCQFSIGSAARYANLSQASVTKLFSLKEGVTPAEYVSRLRVEKGAEYLKSGISVMETARRIGFSSEETFIRVFKRYMGETPGSWKRNNL